MGDINISDAAMEILKERYFLRNNKGEIIEDWDGLCKRVSKAVADTKEYEQDFYEMLYNKEFIPNTPCLINAGTDFSMLAACFVIPISDSMSGPDSITEAIKNTMVISKYGGGVGMPFSDLRPSGDIVQTTKRESSGPISFLKAIDSAADAVKQGGVRRSAQMGTMLVSHPDIEKFIECKKDEGDIANFNISVCVTDKFMECVENKKKFPLVNPRTKKVVKYVDANKLMDKIIKNAWTNGEPGIIFIDRVNEQNPINYLGEIKASNPCVSGDTLVLTKKGNIPIKDLVDTSVEIWNGYEWSEVQPKVTGHNQMTMLVRFSNHKELRCTLNHKFLTTEGRIDAYMLQVGDTVEVFYYPGSDIAVEGITVTEIIKDCEILDQVYCFTDYKNHTGIFNGIMTGQCGEQMLLPYESCVLGHINLVSLVDKGAFQWDEFRTLIRKGVRFLDNCIDVSYFPLNEIKEATQNNRRIGLGVLGLADCFSLLGIEYGSEESYKLAEDIAYILSHEAFSYSEILSKEKGSFPNFDSKKYSHPIHGRTDGIRNACQTTIAPTGTTAMILDASYAIEPHFSVAYTKNVMDRKMKVVNPYFKKIAEEKGLWSINLLDKIIDKGTEAIPDELKDIFITADKLTPEQHIKMQSVFQKYVDSSISKSVNLPNSATEKDIKDIYLLAYNSGCKGTTVYRDGSRSQQVVDIKKREREGLFRYKRRPKIVKGTTEKLETPYGNVYVILNEDNEHTPIECFIDTKDLVQPVPELLSTIAVLISGHFKYGVPIDRIVNLLKGFKGEQGFWDGGKKMRSIADALGKMIEDRFAENFHDEKETNCPDC